MAKPLYTVNEVFVREFISNVSDACEKFQLIQAASQAQSLIDETARTFAFEGTRCTRAAFRHLREEQIPGFLQYASQVTSNLVSTMLQRLP